jgi:endo-1,4-beta-xylanase
MVANGDPEIKLWLNDYDILTGKKLVEYMAQIRKFLKQGVPIAGIGVQGHLHAETFDRVNLKTRSIRLHSLICPFALQNSICPGRIRNITRPKIETYR